MTEFFPEFNGEAGLCRQFVSIEDLTVFEASGPESARAYGAWCIAMHMTNTNVTIPADAAHARMCERINWENLRIRLLERSTLPPHNRVAAWLERILGYSKAQPSVSPNPQCFSGEKPRTVHRLGDS